MVTTLMRVNLRIVHKTVQYKAYRPSNLPTHDTNSISPIQWRIWSVFINIW